MTFCVEPGRARKDRGASELQLAAGASDPQTGPCGLPDEGTSQCCDPRGRGRRTSLSGTTLDLLSKN